MTVDHPSHPPDPLPWQRVRSFPESAMPAITLHTSDAATAHP
jgi:hypothetical protein